VSATLIYHGGALGDFCATMPAIARWRAAYPSEHIVLLGRREHGTLAMCAGLIDESVDIDAAGSSVFFSPDSSRAADALAKFTTAILFAAPDSSLLVNIRKSAIPRVLHQPPFPADRTPVAEYHCTLLSEIGVRSGGRRWSITVDPDADTPGAELLRGAVPVAIHPGSGGEQKNWPIDRFLTVANALRMRGFPIAWLLGPAETTITPPPGDLALRDIPLQVLVGALRRCALYIGNDCGVTHLAALSPCPTIALFGPSDPLVWAPVGKDVHVLYRERPCAPCHLSRRSPISCARECMKSISVEDVVSKALICLSKTGG
jgi:heptosyltransferase-3